MAAETRKHPFLLPIEELAEALNTDVDRGLTSAQVAEAHQKYPPNELDIGSGIAWYTIFIRQLCNAMILVRALALNPPGFLAFDSWLTRSTRSSSLLWPSALV